MTKGGAALPFDFDAADAEQRLPPLRYVPVPRRAGTGGMTPCEAFKKERLGAVFHSPRWAVRESLITLSCRGRSSKALLLRWYRPSPSLLFGRRRRFVRSPYQVPRCCHYRQRVRIAVTIANSRRSPAAAGLPDFLPAFSS